MVAKIRGVTSYGMLCSKSELNLSNDSEGIIELNKKYDKNYVSFLKTTHYDLENDNHTIMGFSLFFNNLFHFYISISNTLYSIF